MSASCFWINDLTVPGGPQVFAHPLVMVLELFKDPEIGLLLLREFSHELSLETRQGLFLVLQFRPCRLQFDVKEFGGSLGLLLPHLQILLDEGGGQLGRHVRNDLGIFPDIGDREVAFLLLLLGDFDQDILSHQLHNLFLARPIYSISG